MNSELIDKAARAIAQENGDDYDQIPKHKPDWIDHRGEFAGRSRDINEPFQIDYDAMAQAAMEAIGPTASDALYWTYDYRDRKREGGYGREDTTDLNKGIWMGINAVIKELESRTREKTP